MNTISSDAYEKFWRLLIEARQESGLTQAEVAARLGVSQSFVSKYELGERRLDVIELLRITDILRANVHDLISQITTGADYSPPVSILQELGLTVSELTNLIHDNPSLRGMVVGYAAEQKLQAHFQSSEEITYIGKPDDHDRQNKGDHIIRYRGHQFSIEIKSLQTRMVTRDGNIWRGRAQVDASDRRTVILADGSTLETTLLAVGEFDILAVNCFAFGEGWNFVFAKNEDLPRSRYRNYSDQVRNQLLASLVPVSWPPEPPFAEDLLSVLDRIVARRK
jgi:transcriptional regulator with XRE-family HTH domain